jgi:RimJ/RimL family protein N-acetyltransferase
MTDTTPPTDPRPDDSPWPSLRWPPPADIVLLGTTVELRPVKPEHDAAALFAVLDHDDVWRHVRGRPASPNAYAAALAASIVDGRLPWIIRLRAAYRGFPAGSVVGTSSYLEVAPVDARLEIGATAYTPALWGSAVNPDTKLALLRYAFAGLGAGRVQLKTDIRNHRSQRAIAGIGAHFEGVLRRYQRRTDDSVRDTVLFSIIAEEWPAAEAALVSRVQADPNN